MYRKLKLSLLFTLTFLVVIIIIVVFKQTEIKSDIITGSSVNGYNYAIKIQNDEYIPSTQEEINTMSDNSYVNIDYLVIYEQNKWFKHNKSVIDIMRFERDFPDYDENLLNANTDYYRLVDEIIKNIDKKHSIFVRLYEKYNQNHSLWRLEPLSIIIPRVNSTLEAKQLISSINSDFLKLLPNTIVNDELLNKWDNTLYAAHYEYTAESPKGLTIEMLIDADSSSSEDTPNTTVEVDNTKIKFKSGETVDVAKAKLSNSVFEITDTFTNADGHVYDIYNVQPDSNDVVIFLNNQFSTLNYTVFNKAQISDSETDGITVVSESTKEGEVISHPILSTTVPANEFYPMMITVDVTGLDYIVIQDILQNIYAYNFNLIAK